MSALTIPLHRLPVAEDFPGWHRVLLDLRWDDEIRAAAASLLIKSPNADHQAAAMAYLRWGYIPAHPLGSNAEGYEAVNSGPPRLWVILATAALWAVVLFGLIFATSTWMTAHNAERIEIERMIP